MLSETWLPFIKPVCVGLITNGNSHYNLGGKEVVKILSFKLTRIITCTIIEIPFSK